MIKRSMILLCASFFLLACHSDSGENVYAPEPDMMHTYTEKTSAGEADYQTEARYQPGSSEVREETVARKMIRTADLELEVENYAKGRKRVGELVARFQADITSEEEQKFSYRIQNRLAIRLAPEKLDSFILALESMALHVASKSIRVEDVTRQYVDLETRLAAKRATVDRYREILRTARTVQDVLAVEEKMRQVIEDIESTERQLRYLRDRVQQSTVNVLLYEAFDQPEVRRRNFFQRMGNALIDGWQVFLNILVGLTSVWPVMLILIALVWWLTRRLKRRRNN